MQATLVGPAASPGVLLYNRSHHSNPLPPSTNTYYGRFTKPSYSGLRVGTNNFTEGSNGKLNRVMTGNDELVWYDRQVTWSRGAQIYRRFTFDHEAEDVACASFISFWIGSETVKQGDEEIRALGTSSSTSGTKGKKVDMQLDNQDQRQSQIPRRTFGPFHTSQHASWGLSAASSTSSTSSSKGPRRLVRSLAIFLQTRAHVYLPTGEDIVVHMPFVVDSVFPLKEGGVLVQRALEKRERHRLFDSVSGWGSKLGGRHGHGSGPESAGGGTASGFGVKGGRGSILRGLIEEEEISFGGNQSALSALDELVDLDEKAPELPRLYTLDNLFDELKMVVEASIERDSTSTLSSPSSQQYLQDDPSAAALGPIPTPRVVGVSSIAPIPAYQHLVFLSEIFVVIYDCTNNTLVLYQRIRYPSVPETTPPPTTARTMRPSDIFNTSTATGGPRASTGPTVAARSSTSTRLSKGDGKAMKGRTSSTRTASTTVANAADRGDRGQRRAPRLSRGVSLGMVGPSGASGSGSGTGVGGSGVDVDAEMVSGPSVVAAANDLQATFERDRVAEVALSTSIGTRRSSAIGATGGRASLSSDTSRRVSGVGVSVGQMSANFMREDAEAFKAPTTSALGFSGASGNIGAGVDLGGKDGSGGSRVKNGGLGGGMIGVAEKDLRETTMMLGLERDEEGVRSDVVLEKIWVWRLPGEVRDAKEINIFLSDNTSPSSTYLNVHLPSINFLYIFHIQHRASTQSPITSIPQRHTTTHRRSSSFPSFPTSSSSLSPSASMTITEIQAIECISALPIFATRRDVVDTLVLGEDGRLWLITSSGRRVEVGDLPDGRDEVARKLASTLSMGVEVGGSRFGIGGMSTGAGKEGEGGGRKVVRLVDSCGSTFTAIWSDGDQLRIRLNGFHQVTSSLQPSPNQSRLPTAFSTLNPSSTDPLVYQCLKAIAYLLPAQEIFEIKRDLLLETISTSAGETLNDTRPCSWERLSFVLRRFTGLQGLLENQGGFERSTSCSSDPVVRRLARRLGKRPRQENRAAVIGSMSPTPTWKVTRTATTAQVMLALHLIAQDCRLSSSRLKDILRLVPLILELSVLLGRNDWKDYWLRLIPSASTLASTNSDSHLTLLHAGSNAKDEMMETQENETSTILDKFKSPPDIVQYLSRRLVKRLKPFASLDKLGETLVNEFGQTKPCEQTSLVCEIYDLLGVGSTATSEIASTTNDVIKRAWATVTHLVMRGLGPEWIADLPPGVALPILDMLRICQVRPNKSWSREIFNLIGREDLAARCLGDKAAAWDTKNEPSSERPTIRELMMGVVGKQTASYQPAVYVRFGQDRRVQEVERIMQTEHLRTLHIQDPPGANEQAIIQYHQSVVNTIANRTLSVTVGQGIFEYGTRTTVITDTWNIPLIEVAVKVVPGNSVYKAQIAAEAAEWPCFHNGVSRGLSISPDCKGVDSSWIVYNRPQTLNPEHAGFLLGLGLTGHLRALRAYHAFPYLGPRHDLTSIGLLLGLACSFAGSEDTLVTKMLSLHTHALLPLGSMELNASPLVQSSALVGLGLVFVGSRSLRMAEVALSEVGRKDMPGVEGFAIYSEAYSFSASMAFGLIMLGRGGSNEVDRKMVAQLSRCIHGQVGNRSIDSTITSPGATLALGLMYLRSGRKDVADVLKLPQSAIELESVRPELLLIRTFARALIMWDSVRPSSQWFEEQFPPFIRSAHGDHKRTTGMELATELAYLSIIAGASLAVGLKHAGTASEAAHNSLMFFFGVLGKAAAGGSMTYEGKIRRNAARQALNIVTIALAVTMSGTGELNVLRRLRVSHGQEGAGVTYGSHMAMHMALGILFLGRGYYTLGDSDLAIAAMSIAFFPRFAASPADNKAYPQAFRHLWALAVEPRCITARDVDTRETVYLPIKLHTRAEEKQAHNLISPTLVAPFDTLKSMYVDSPRYFSVDYDIINDPRDRSSLVETRTIWIKRKAGYADYNVDPKGNRSIFVRAGAMSGLDTHYDLISPAEPPGLSAGEVNELMLAHSNDSTLVALSELFSGPKGKISSTTSTATSTLTASKDSTPSAPIDSFIRTVLLECLSLDKLSAISVYLDLYLGLNSGWKSDSSLNFGGDISTAAKHHIKKGDGLEFIRKTQLGLIKTYINIADSLYAAPPIPGEKKFSTLRPSFVSALWRRGPPPPSEETRIRYWATGEWPSSIDSDSEERVIGEGPSEREKDIQNYRLAAFLEKRNVPSIEVLQALSNRVREYRRKRLERSGGADHSMVKAEAGVVGQEREEAVLDEQIVVLKVRDAARKYGMSVRAQWDEEVGGGGDMNGTGNGVDPEDDYAWWDAGTVEEAVRTWQ